MAAVAAQDDRRGPAPVEDEDRLLAGVRVERPERARERARQQAALPRRELRAQVDDLDLGRRPDRARGQDDAVVGAVARPPDALDRGRGRAEDERRTGQLRQPDRRIAGLEPGRPVALVGRVVLLVDDDQPDVGERRHDRQPRPDDDVDVARPDPPPLVGPLPFPEPRVDERDPSVEVRAQPVDERQRQRDLGDEDERRAAGLERAGDGLDVDRRLAAAGHAVEQQRPRVGARSSRPGSARPLRPGPGAGRSPAGGRRAVRPAVRRAAGGVVRGPRPRPGRAGPARPARRSRGGRPARRPAARHRVTPRPRGGRRAGADRAPGPPAAPRHRSWPGPPGRRRSCGSSVRSAVRPRLPATSTRG